MGPKMGLFSGAVGQIGPLGSGVPRGGIIIFRLLTETYLMGSDPIFFVLKINETPLCNPMSSFRG